MRTFNEMVSVIMPVCNDKTYFQKAVSSIFQQTYKNWELLIIDSSDNKEEIPHLLNFDDSRIRYFYREKKGIADALNFAIDKCNGKFVARMDADDISEIERFEKQVSFLDKNPDVDIVGSSYYVINEKDDIVQQKKLPSTHEEIFAKLIFDNPICHPTVMFRRKVFDEGNRYRKVYAEDYDLWTKLIWEYRFANIEYPLIRYRKHGLNASQIGEKRCCDSDMKSCKEFIERMISEKLDGFDEWFLIKNYRLFLGELKVSKVKNDFLVNQYILLKKIFSSKSAFCVNNDMNSYIDIELRNRWKNIFMLYSVFDEKLRNFYEQNIYEHSEDYVETLYDTILHNEEIVENLKNKKIRFFLYGYGERAKETVKHIEKIECDNWHFMGVIDKDKKSYAYKGEMRETIMFSEINMNIVDYIFISVRNSYYEVKDMIIQKDVPKDKVLGDSLFYYL